MVATTTSLQIQLVSQSSPEPVEAHEAGPYMDSIDVGTQTVEELISEQQCQAIMKSAEESINQLIEQMDSLLERLAQHERNAHARSQDESEWSHPSTTPLPGPSIHTGEFAAQPLALREARDRHTAQRRALKEQRRMYRNRQV